MIERRLTSYALEFGILLLVFQNDFFTIVFFTFKALIFIFIKAQKGKLFDFLLNSICGSILIQSED